MSERIFSGAQILLPRTDLEHFSVVACDQYTSQLEYWRRVEAEVGDRPSALRMILPEALLGERESRLPKVWSAMEDYLKGGVFREPVEGYILVERTQSDGRVRLGVVGAVDLEQYDYSPTSGSAIRPTEGTVTERLPPRTEVRMGAALELPHIMLLVDDPGMTAIEPLYARRDEFEKLYDFELMEGGGHLRGWLLPGDCGLEPALDALETAERRRAESEHRAPLIYAVGDGNHSLAAAKLCYSSAPREGRELLRYALVELVNLHSPSLEFEAIHRVVSGVEPDRLLESLTEYCDEGDGGQGFLFAAGERRTRLRIREPKCATSVGSLQKLLDDCLSLPGECIDYIHGDDVALELAQHENVSALLLEPMAKSDLFPAVANGGPLERKSFSMGHAADKRFYLEARRLRK